MYPPTAYVCALTRVSFEKKIREQKGDIYISRPHPCEITHILFRLYTNDCRVSVQPNNYNIVMLSLLRKDWILLCTTSSGGFDTNHLILNVSNTQEMIFDPRQVADHEPVVLKNRQSFRCPRINTLVFK